jgi:hypothetical protein
MKSIFILILLILTASCHKLSNRLEVIQLECGTFHDGKRLDVSHTYVKALLGERPVFKDKDDLDANLRIVGSLLERRHIQATTKGCMAIRNELASKDPLPIRFVDVKTKTAADVMTLSNGSIKLVQFSSEIYQQSKVATECTSTSTTQKNLAETLTSTVKFSGNGLFKVKSVVLTRDHTEVVIENKSVTLGTWEAKQPILMLADGQYVPSFNLIDGHGNEIKGKFDNKCIVDLDSTEPSFAIQQAGQRLASQEVFHLNPGMALSFATDASEFEFRLCQSVLLPCKPIDGLSISFTEEGNYSVKGSLKKRNGLEKDIEIQVIVDNTPPQLETQWSGTGESYRKLSFQIPDSGALDLSVKLSDNFTENDHLHDTLECSFSRMAGMGSSRESNFTQLEIGPNSENRINIASGTFQSCAEAFVWVNGVLTTKVHLPLSAWYSSGLTFKLRVRDRSGLITEEFISAIADSSLYFNRIALDQSAINLDLGVKALASGDLIALGMDGKSILISNTGSEWRTLSSIQAAGFSSMETFDGKILLNTLDDQHFIISQNGVEEITKLRGYVGVIPLAPSSFIASKDNILFRLDDDKLTSVGPTIEYWRGSKCNVFSLKKVICGGHGQVHELSLGSATSQWSETKDVWNFHADPQHLAKVKKGSIEIVNADGFERQVPIEIESTWIRDIFVDNKGRVWRVTEYTGIEVYDGATWRSLSSNFQKLPETLFSKFVHANSQLLGIFDRKSFFPFKDHSVYSEISLDGTDHDVCERIAGNSQSFALSCSGDVQRQILRFSNRGLEITSKLQNDDPVTVIPDYSQSNTYIVGTRDGFKILTKDMRLEDVSGLGNHDSSWKYSRLLSGAIAFASESIIALYENAENAVFYTTQEMAQFIEYVLDRNNMPKNLTIKTLADLQDQSNLTKPFSISPKLTYVGGAGGFFQIENGEISFVKMAPDEDVVTFLRDGSLVLTTSSLRNKSGELLLELPRIAFAGTSKGKNEVIFCRSDEAVYVLEVDEENKIVSNTFLHDLKFSEIKDIDYSGGKLWVLSSKRIIAL